MNEKIIDEGISYIPFFLIALVIAVPFAIGYFIGYSVAERNIDAACDLGLVDVVTVRNIQAFEQGTELFCDDGLIIDRYDCDSCSYWVKGHGTCAYKNGGLR